MPEKETIERARRDKREGKAPSTQAGEFVREEIEHIREGKHGARSTKQAIAIGLSKARRAGVKLPPPENASEETKEQAEATRVARERNRHDDDREPARKRLRKNHAPLRRRQRSHGRRARLRKNDRRRRVRVQLRRPPPHGRSNTKRHKKHKRHKRV